MNAEPHLSPLYRKEDGLRLFSEEDSPYSGANYRTPFRRDYGRLIHCASFRRLQGKTQLFPGFESDYFRSRLTHSLEVAQIAKTIALRLNAEIPYLRSHPINPDVVEVAALAHDLGHPPFGHNGEKALDKCMRQFGGFEGNAQVLRILLRAEKKHFRPSIPSRATDVGVDSDGTDYRAGLNLSARCLASVLKYDEEIPLERTEKEGIVKGYYASEAALVAQVKDLVLGYAPKPGTFQTLECHIMDIADDIAYSTYDLEDTLKAGFLTPLGMIAGSDDFFEVIAQDAKCKPDDVITELTAIFGSLASAPAAHSILAGSMHVFRASESIAGNAHFRIALTSQLIGEMVEGVRFDLNESAPPLSRAYLEHGVGQRVAILKALTRTVIMSPRVRVAEYRGADIVREIFEALNTKEGSRLLPNDYQTLFSRTKDTTAQKRILSDFIAGMTDGYAVEFYARLKSEDAESIFKPF